MNASDCPRPHHDSALKLASCDAVSKAPRLYGRMFTRTRQLRLPMAFGKQCSPVTVPEGCARNLEVVITRPQKSVQRTVGIDVSVVIPVR